MSETIITKTCTNCKQIKPLTEFHKHKTCKYGFCSSCKNCRHEYRTSENRRKHDKQYRQTENYAIAKKKYYKSEKRIITQDIYNQSEKGQKIRSKHSKIHRQKYPKRIIARHAVSTAVRYGKLPRPDSLPCHYCPKSAQQYHHHLGYEPKHWLDVVPICRSCHYFIHKAIA